MNQYNRATIAKGLNSFKYKAVSYYRNGKLEQVINTSSKLFINDTMNIKAGSAKVEPKECFAYYEQTYKHQVKLVFCGAKILIKAHN